MGGSCEPAGERRQGRVEAIARLRAAHDAAIDDEATRKRLSEIGAELPTAAQRTPQALQSLVDSEVERWTAVLKVAG